MKLPKAHNKHLPSLLRVISPEVARKFMKIRDLLNQFGPSFSFEFFPPRDETGFEELFESVRLLRRLHPTFISVTYGAGGSTRVKTIGLVARIKQELVVETMAHLTCVGASREELRKVLDELVSFRIENVLALRGDPPKGQKNFMPHPEGFGYGNELVSFIRSNFDFCIGAAAYPEKHPECPSPGQDLENLKRKVDAGADFLITQLFFDNRYYFDLVSRARRIGIKVPIIPGIMPILNVLQIKRFTELCGARIPVDLLKTIEAVQDDPHAVEHCGVLHAASQCRELLSRGAPGIHFYTLNKSRATWAIFEYLKS